MDSVLPFFQGMFLLCEYDGKNGNVCISGDLLFSNPLLSSELEYANLDAALSVCWP